MERINIYKKDHNIWIDNKNDVKKILKFLCIIPFLICASLYFFDSDINYYLYPLIGFMFLTIVYFISYADDYNDKIDSYKLITRSKEQGSNLKKDFIIQAKTINNGWYDYSIFKSYREALKTFDKLTLTEKIINKDFDFSILDQKKSIDLIYCPDCKVPMDKKEYLDIEIDKCNNCEAVFLNGGELDKIINHIKTNSTNECGCDSDFTTGLIFGAMIS